MTSVIPWPLHRYHRGHGFKSHTSLKIFFRSHSTTSSEVFSAARISYIQIKNSSNWWSPPLFLWPYRVFQGWYWRENKMLVTSRGQMAKITYYITPADRVSWRFKHWQTLLFLLDHWRAHIKRIYHTIKLTLLPVVAKKKNSCRSLENTPSLQGQVRRLLQLSHRLHARFSWEHFY